MVNYRRGKSGWQYRIKNQNILFYIKKGVKNLANTSKFNGKSSDYHLYRPDYPEPLLDDIIFEGHLDQYSIIADIGSGTGIMAKKWLNRGMKTYGVEPNGEMRKMAEETLGGNPLFFSIDGSAELPDCRQKALI